MPKEESTLKIIVDLLPSSHLHRTEKTTLKSEYMRDHLTLAFTMVIDGHLGKADICEVMRNIKGALNEDKVHLSIG